MTYLRYYDILRVGEDPANEVVRRSHSNSRFSAKMTMVHARTT